jgi:hypothetical protein
METVQTCFPYNPLKSRRESLMTKADKSLSAIIPPFEILSQVEMRWFRIGAKGKVGKDVTLCR